MLPTHQRDCESALCRGCQPCPERHCQLCYREHVTHEGRGTDQTCATCINQIRTHITGIVGYATRMLGEAIMRGINSEAADLHGPAANPLAWQQRGTYGHRYDPDTRLADNHPLWVLGTWEQKIARHLGQHRTGRVTITEAARYLDLHLTRLAHDHDFELDNLAEAISDCHTHMETVLRDGDQIDRGAPCPMCGRANLRKDHGDAIDDDRWRCPRHDCNAAYTEHDYRQKVQAIYVTQADRLTASQIAATYRVPEATVRQWASRGHVRTHGKDDHGRQLYDVPDTLAKRDGDTQATA